MTSACSTTSPPDADRTSTRSATTSRSSRAISRAMSVPKGGPPLRGRLPPSGAAVRPALDPGPAAEQRDEHPGHAEHPARRARRGRATGRLRLVLVCLRRQPGAAQAREPADAADLAVRDGEARGGGYCRSFSVIASRTGWEPALRYFNVFGARKDPTSQYASCRRTCSSPKTTHHPPIDPDPHQRPARRFVVAWSRNGSAWSRA